jgi:hypothetical protein
MCLTGEFLAHATQFEVCGIEFGMTVPMRMRIRTTVVGAAFRFECALNDLDLAAKVPDHGCENGIRFDVYGIAREHGAYVTIGQVVHQANQIQPRGSGDAKELLRVCPNSQVLSALR